MLLRFVTVFLVLASVVSCGYGRIGYGVLYWENDETEYETAEIIPVLKESKIRKVYLIVDKDGKTKREIPVWSVRFFRDRAKAESFADSYGSWKFFYGYSQKRGLPVREEPKQESRIIYKMREEQVVKIVGRSDEPSQEGIYENYWYHILTRDGYMGYCFGEFLNVYETETDPYEMAKEYQAKDVLLDFIMSQVWRPQYYEEMIEEQRFDLARFRADVGLFPHPLLKKVELVTDTDSYIFEYASISKYGRSSYVFEGTDLRLEVIRREKLNVTYKVRGKPVSYIYVLIDQDIDKIVEEEALRRKALYKPFVGSTLTSSAYGTITFESDGSFAWLDYEKLSSIFQNKEIKGHGRVDFPCYVGDALKGEYDGVITFHFAGSAGGENISFLYRFDVGGVKFVVLNRDDIRDLVVLKTSVSPFILFFTMK
jgi:hypothetical protein